MISKGRPAASTHDTFGRIIKKVPFSLAGHRQILASCRALMSVPPQGAFVHCAYYST